MENIVTEKQCSTCGEYKHISEFCKDKSRGDGRSYVCRTCHSIRSKRYDSANKEIRRDRQRKYIEENRGLLRERTRLWGRNHKDKKAERARNRRAWKKNSAGKITLTEWEDLKNKYGNRCLCCGRMDVDLTLDHIIPLSKGGENIIDNAQPLCRGCNGGKRDKTIDYRPF